MLFLVDGWLYFNTFTILPPGTINSSFLRTFINCLKKKKDVSGTRNKWRRRNRREETTFCLDGASASLKKLCGQWELNMLWKANSGSLLKKRCSSREELPLPTLVFQTFTSILFSLYSSFDKQREMDSMTGHFSRLHMNFTTMPGTAVELWWTIVDCQMPDFIGHLLW